MSEVAFELDSRRSMNVAVQEDPSSEWKNECYKYNHACYGLFQEN